MSISGDIYSCPSQNPTNDLERLVISSCNPTYEARCISPGIASPASTSIFDDGGSRTAVSTFRFELFPYKPVRDTYLANKTI